MREGQIRVVAICLIYRGDEIFVAEGFDSVKESYFYRPLGGGVEFGEHGHEAVAREFQEEVKADLKEVRYTLTLENLFTFEGGRGHEIVRVYEASFVDTKFYEQAQIQGIDDGDVTFTALWTPLAVFRRKEVRLVPEALLPLLGGES